MLVTPRLDHFAIAANDTDAMVAWYGKVLGLVVHVVMGPLAPQTQKVYLIGPPAKAGNPVHGGMMIEVMPANGAARRERASHEPGISHVAWYVENFDEAITHLRVCDVHFLGDVVQAIGGGRLVSFADCEGNMMQIVERK